MKKLLLYALLFAFLLSIPAYAQMGSQQGGQMGQGMMGEKQMMECPMQQMSGQEMKQCGRPMMEQGTGMMGVRMRMDREGMGHYRRWFQYGVTLMLQNADKLGLSDEQRKQLDGIRIRYSKDIIKQDAEMKIAEIDLGSLLKEPEINLSEVKEALKKVEDTKTQIRYLRIMAFVEARKILTGEQRNSLKKLMEMRPAPGMRRIMSSSEPEEGEETEETLEGEGSKTDIQGH